MCRGTGLDQLARALTSWGDSGSAADKGTPVQEPWLRSGRGLRAASSRSHRRVPLPGPEFVRGAR